MSKRKSCRSFGVLPILLFAGCFMLLPAAAIARNTITTVAGGGPLIPAAPRSVSLGQPTAGIAADSAGNLYIPAATYSQVYKITPAGQLTILAGTGALGFTGDGGPATSAELSQPAAVAVDTAGNVYIADSAVIRKVDVSTGKISTVAGGNGWGYSGDGGPATSAQLYGPNALAVDLHGNIYLVDSQHNVIRKIAAATGVINTIAGNGTRGYSGDGGPATLAQLQYPVGVAVDSTGNLYIADFVNKVVRKVVVSTGIISTVAGGGTLFTDGIPATTAAFGSVSGVALDAGGNIYVPDSNKIREIVARTGLITTVAGSTGYGYSGDGGPATLALLGAPWGVALDSNRNIYIVDYLNTVIRKVDGTTGIISTVAGNQKVYSGDGGPAHAAQFATVAGVAVANLGDIYISDNLGQVVRKVEAASGNITTFAGSGTAGNSGDGGPATSARIGDPRGLAVDHSGNLYIVDRANNVVRGVQTSTGNIATLAGNGAAGYSGNGGWATSAQLNQPTDAAVDSAGNVFIADNANHVVREVMASTGIIKTVAGNGTAGYTGDGQLATLAKLNTPSSIAVDAANNLYIADFVANVVREVVASSGLIKTVAGNGTKGIMGDGGPATNASLYAPVGLAIDPVGDIFFGDAAGLLIREVTPDGIIQTVAGTGVLGFSGDGGPALNAQLEYLTGLAGNFAGDLFLTDSMSRRVRKIAGLFRQKTVTLNLSATSVNFGNVPVGQTSGFQTVTVTNSGTQTANISSTDFAGVDNGDYEMSAGTCGEAPFTIDPGTHCTVILTLSPSMPGVESATFFVTDNASNSPQKIVLSGTGTEPVFSPSATSLTFTSQPQGTTSDAQTVTITNAGTGNLIISMITKEGTNAGDFAKSADTCTAFTIAPHGTCKVSVTFTPSATGSRSASLRFIHNASSSPQTVNLAGTGGPPITVSLSPVSASIALSGTQVLTATIANTTSTALNWYVNGVLNGNSTQGTLTACTSVAPRTCKYTAPSISVPSPNPAVIKVASIADPTKYKTASVTVTIPPVVVTLGPASASKPLGGTQVFTATISGTTNTSLNWYVNGVLSGNAAQGTLTGSGLTRTYTAPASSLPSPNPAVIKVASVADPTKYKTASVTVTIPLIVVTLSPASASKPLGGAQLFTATITGTANAVLNWYVNGALNGNSAQGTLTGTGLMRTYTAPAVNVPSPNPAIIKVASAANAAIFKTASLAVTDSIVVTLSPAISTRTRGATLRLTATISNTSNTAVNWYVNGILNGNSTQGTLTGTGLIRIYTAPSVNAPSPNPAVIKVVSVADPAKSSTATVTVSGP